MSTPWGTDTPISMPEPLRRGVKVAIDMGGFAFTKDGIVHNFTVTDLETYTTPTFLPQFDPKTE